MPRMKSASGSYTAYDSEVYAVPYEEEAPIEVIGQAHDNTIQTILYGRVGESEPWQEIAQFTGDFTAIVPLWARQLYAEVTDPGATGGTTTLHLTRGQRWTSDVDPSVYTVPGTVGWTAPAYPNIPGSPPPFDISVSISNFNKASPLWEALFGPQGGGGGGGGGGNPTPAPGVAQAVIADIPADRFHAKQFLARAQGHYRPADVDALMSGGISAYLLDQYTQLGYDPVEDMRAEPLTGMNFVDYVPTNNAVDSAPLRGKAANTLLSFVAINLKSIGTDDYARADFVRMYQELAFGTYYDFIRAVTFHPAMGEFLSHFSNPKEGTVTPGQKPDENYAREIMQLFTVGLEEHDQFGVRVVDGQTGLFVSNYDDNDIAEAAKVMTGIQWDARVANTGAFIGSGGYVTQFGGSVTASQAEIRQTSVDPAFHDDTAKSVMGWSSPGGLNATAEIDGFIQYLVTSHPSTAGYVCGRMIRYMASQNPSPECVGRVVNAWNTGHYILPDGTEVGSGSEGDLWATFCAILCDEYVNDPVGNPDSMTNTGHSGVIDDPYRFYVRVIGTGYAPILGGFKNCWQPDTWDRNWDFPGATGSEGFLGILPSIPGHAINGVFGDNDPYHVRNGSRAQVAGLTSPTLQVWKESVYGEVGNDFAVNAFRDLRSNSNIRTFGSLLWPTDADMEAWAVANDVVAHPRGISDSHTFQDGSKGSSFVTVPGLFAAGQAAWDAAIAGGDDTTAAHAAYSAAIVDVIEDVFFARAMSNELKNWLIGLTANIQASGNKVNWNAKSDLQKIETARFVVLSALMSPEFLYY